MLINKYMNCRNSNSTVLCISNILWPSLVHRDGTSLKGNKPSLVHHDGTSLKGNKPSLVHRGVTSLNSNKPSLVHCHGNSLYNNNHSSDSTNKNVYTNQKWQWNKKISTKAINLSAKQPHQFGTQVKIWNTSQNSEDLDWWFSPRRSLYCCTFPLDCCGCWHK
jgi:hypothetical protein